MNQDAFTFESHEWLGVPMKYLLTRRTFFKTLTLSRQR